MDRKEIRVGDVEMMLVPQSFPAKMLGGDSNHGPSASKAGTLPLSYAGPLIGHDLVSFFLVFING